VENIHNKYSNISKAALQGRGLYPIIFGQILSSSLGGIFGEFISWRDIFLLFGVTSLLVAFVFWLATRHISQPPRKQAGNIFSTLKPYLQLMTKPAARLVITAVFIEGFFLFGGFAYVGAFIRDSYHLPYVTIGMLLSGFGMGGLLYSISVKWLVQKLGEKGLVMVGGLLVGSCYLSITILPDWILFVPRIILIGLGFYMMHSTLQTQATELSPESRGTAVSLFAFNLFLGQGIGAMVLGRIVDNAGYIPCFIVCGIAVAGLAIWFASQMRYLKPSENPSS
jgi:predicted MFS family arabinose efflux permease